MHKKIITVTTAPDNKGILTSFLLDLYKKNMIWALGPWREKTWLLYGNNKSTDQPAYPLSLISESNWLN